MWLDVKQSKYILAFIISVHSLAILSCLFLAVALAFKLLLVFLLCDSLYFHYWRYQKAYYLLSLKYTTEFAWEIFRNNRLTSIRILNSSVLASFVIILHIQMNKKQRTVLVCRDAVSAEEYRQLLVALKITLTNSDE